MWILVDRPKASKPGEKPNIIDSRWIFKVKNLPDESKIYKARLVVRGFKDKNIYDVSETYAPVSRLSLVRIVLATIVHLDLEACQLDVKTAFLNGVIEEEIYMEIPEGIKVSNEVRKSKVCKLKKRYMV